MAFGAGHEPVLFRMPSDSGENIFPGTTSRSQRTPELSMEALNAKTGNVSCGARGFCSSAEISGGPDSLLLSRHGRGLYGAEPRPTRGNGEGETVSWAGNVAQKTLAAIGTTATEQGGVTCGPHASSQHTANGSRFHSSLWRYAPNKTQPI